MKRLKRKEKTLEERVAFLEKAHKKRVKFKAVLTMYKYIKDIYAQLENMDEEIKNLCRIRSVDDGDEKKEN